jgi:hypothetical protein
VTANDPKYFSISYGIEQQTAGFDESTENSRSCRRQALWHLAQFVIKAVFTRCKFSPASQAQGMRARTFHVSRIMEVATRFRVKPVELFISGMKRLRAHPRHLTRASKLASCKRRLNTCGFLSFILSVFHFLLFLFYFPFCLFICLFYLHFSFLLSFFDWLFIPFYHLTSLEIVTFKPNTTNLIEN